MLPEQLIAFRVYKNGNNCLGVATVDLPELAYVTETLAGSGIAGEIEQPTLGMTSSMTATLNWTSQSSDFYNLLNPAQGNLLELRASLQVSDPASGLRSSSALRVLLQGENKNSAGGKFETGKKQDNTTVIEVTRLLVELGGKQKLLIDKKLFIHSINGVDSLLKVRQDLGMPI